MDPAWGLPREGLDSSYIDKPCSWYLALLKYQPVRLAVAPCICTYRYLNGYGLLVVAYRYFTYCAVVYIHMYSTLYIVQST